jgi:5-methylcytosine-specific restriction endonuclease McrA
MSNFVFVLDTQLKPLTPCSPGTARRLLKARKAAIYRRFPFTIVLKKTVEETPQSCRVKIDPGSKVTGLAILKDLQVLWAAELTHRGQAIKDALLSRRQLRRTRRHRKTRYRKPRFLNRKRKPGWLPPSLQHRVDTTLTWVNRLRKVCPLASISQELVRFDTQKLQNPEVSGVEYQQGELFGYEVREYLLEKWGRKCAYCGVGNTPLEVEHIHPQSKGGSNRVSNLTLACHPCNQSKGNRDIRDFLSGKPPVLARILEQAKAPLKDAAAVNATPWELYQRLKETGLPVEVGTGGLTKYNRTRLELPKTHWLDAACVGVTDSLEVCTQQPLKIEAKGHGTRQMCRTDKFGFPKRYVPRFKFVKGFQTGDIVKAIVPQGKKAGIHTGRVAVRSTGSFNITTALMSG